MNNHDMYQLIGKKSDTKVKTGVSVGKTIHPYHLAGHMVSRVWALLPLAVGTLGLGMGIYHYCEGLDWYESYLNAAMLLGGMGPIDPLHTEIGKILAGTYALFAGIVFLVVAGAMLAPVIHHVLNAFHLDQDEEAKTSSDRK